MHQPSHVTLSGPMRRIAILRALFLGDLLMTTPAWRALRDCFPEAEITLIGLPWAAELLPHIPGLFDRFLTFPGYPGIVEVAYDPTATTQFLAEQQAYGYDLAIQMHGNGSASNGFIDALGARQTVGFGQAGDARLDHMLPYNPNEHEIQRWLDLFAAAGIPVAEPTLEFEITGAQQNAAHTLMGAVRGARPMVGLHVGAKNPARRWPPARFAALAQEIHRLSGAAFVLTGTTDEGPIAGSVRAQIEAPLLDLCGQTSLSELAAVVADLDLLVTNDTGVSHLAAALGTPSVIVFGPTHPAQFAPLDKWRHQAIDAREYCPDAPDGAAALAELPLEPVLAAALSLLSRRLLSQGGWHEREIA